MREEGFEVKASTDMNKGVRTDGFPECFVTISRAVQELHEPLPVELKEKAWILKALR
jgi:hypothetical protein